MKAVKYDEGKPRVDLVFGPALLKIAEALTYGASKYTDFNYMEGGGLAYSRLLAALGRHVTAFAMRDPVDKESGLPHWAHAGACIVMLGNLIERGLGVDDRWKREEKADPLPAGIDASGKLVFRNVQINGAYHYASPAAELDKELADYVAAEERKSYENCSNCGGGLAFACSRARGTCVHCAAGKSVWHPRPCPECARLGVP